jgi:hypothetical protein
VDVLLGIFDAACRRLGFVSNESGLRTILEPGKYRIVVSSFAPDTPGSWSVSFACRETAFCRERCLAGTIECGQPASGTLAEDDCDWLFSHVLDAWRLDVPPGGASIRVLGTATEWIYYDLFPVACDAPVPLEQLCQTQSGAYFCDLAPGSYLLDVSTPRNVVLGFGPQPYTIEVTTSACGRYGDQLPGDCNQDGKLDLADGVCLLSHLFRGDRSDLSCAAGGGLAGRRLLDWNGDRKLDLTDPVALLVHLFQSGVPHVLGSECVPGSGCPRTCGG